MTGYDIFKNAITRLEYPTGVDGSNEKRLFLKANEFFSIICNDIKVPVIKDMYSPLEFSGDIVEALCCGVAMLIANTEGDINKFQVFHGLYVTQRMRVLNCIAHIKDKQPTTNFGG